MKPLPQRLAPTRVDRNARGLSTETLRDVDGSHSSLRSLLSWLRYVLVWPAMPPRGDQSLATDIVAVAFGRNSVRDDDLSEVARIAAEAESDSDAMVRLQRNGFDPGGPNRSLADELKQAIDTAITDVRATVQWEIAFALYEQWPSVWRGHESQVRVVWPRVNRKRLSTEDVLVDAVRHLDPEQGHQVLLLAHRRHAPRVLLLWKRLARAVGNVGSRNSIILTAQPTTFFDEHSVQRQTTSAAAWLVRESLVRLHHILTRRT